MVVWDAIKIGIELQKMFWGAGIEIYRVAKSKGPWGPAKLQKKSHHIFGPGERSDNGMLLTAKILLVLCLRVMDMKLLTLV